MTAILTRFLPTQFRGQYWFLDHNFSYFPMETSFLRNDFLLLCQYYSYITAKDYIEDTQAFLVRMDSKGVKWLVFLPDTLYIRELFCNYRIYPLGPSYGGGRALVVTNYRAKR